MLLNQAFPMRAIVQNTEPSVQRTTRMTLGEAAKRVREFEHKKQVKDEEIAKIQEDISENVSGGPRPEGIGRAV